MAPGRWIRLDVNWEDSAWLDGLEAAVSGCWPRLLCRIKRDGTGGRCKRTDPGVLAGKWGVTRDIVTALEQAAIKDEALVIEDGEWVVTNWQEYQDVDPTATDRKRKERAKRKKQLELEASRVTGCDNRDIPGRLSRDIDNDSDIDSEDDGTPLPPADEGKEKGGVGDDDGNPTTTLQVIQRIWPVLTDDPFDLAWIQRMVNKFGAYRVQEVFEDCELRGLKPDNLQPYVAKICKQKGSSRGRRPAPSSGSSPAEIARQKAEQL